MSTSPAEIYEMYLRAKKDSDRSYMLDNSFKRKFGKFIDELTEQEINSLVGDNLPKIINRAGERVTFCSNPDCLEPDAGYYVKYRATGTIHQNYNFDNSEADNSGLYDGISVKQSSNAAFCISCNTRLGTYKE